MMHRPIAAAVFGMTVLIGVASAASSPPSDRVSASGASSVGVSDADRVSNLQAVHDGVMRQIREKELEYEREQEKLQKTKRESVRLGKKERLFLKKLETENAALAKTRQELALLAEAMSELKNDIAATEERHRTESLSLEFRRNLYATRIRAYYLAAAVPQYLGMPGLSAPGDFFAASNLSRTLVLVSELDRSLIHQTSARKAEIELFQELLSAKEKSLQVIQDKMQILEGRQARERRRREEMLAEVRSRKSALDELARQLEEENANMKLLLTSLREQSLRLKEQLAYLKKDFEDKKGLLKWPVSRASIQSVRPYGKIFDETVGGWRVNRGIDILTENNQSVLAVSRGEVVFADFFGRMGNLVILSHGGDYFTLYAHLASISVNLGSKIETGAMLGRAGNTGLLEDAPVLHFEIREGSKAVDPKNWLGGDK